MYSEQDLIDIRRRIARYRAALLPVLAVLAALMVLSLVKRLHALAYVSAALLAAAAVFGILYYLAPCQRYLTFLTDMQKGLSREMVGTVVEISDAVDLQDGARVLPVRILLHQEQDERIIYLNASKRDRFPGPGSRVRVSLCGRHIRDVQPE